MIDPDAVSGVFQPQKAPTDMTVDVVRWMKVACEDRRLHAQVFLHTSDAIRKLAMTEWEEGRLHASDLGGCSAATRARMLGLLDIPFPFQVQLTRLDLGAIYGAHMAAMFKVGWESEHDDGEVQLEVPVQMSDVVGHIDAVLITDDYEYPIEYKTNYFGKGTEPQDPLYAKDPFDRHLPYVYQEGFYMKARGVKAPFGAVCILNPALYRQKDARGFYIDPTMLKQFEYHITELAPLVDAELARLLPVQTGDVACDASEPWRGRYCRWSLCPKKATTKSK